MSDDRNALLARVQGLCAIAGQLRWDAEALCAALRASEAALLDERTLLLTIEDLCNQLAEARRDRDAAREALMRIRAGTPETAWAHRQATDALAARPEGETA